MHFCTTIVALAVLLLVSAAPCSADPVPTTPFYSSNQSPLVQIYGLPMPESAIIQPRGRTSGLLARDVANSFASDNQNGERILLDGESYRLTLALRRSVSKTLEIGMDLPFVGYNGGIFDAFIEEWHSFFGMPQGHRDEAPHGRLLFRYERDEQERLRVDDASFGLGDIRLTGGWQLYHDGTANPAAVAVRASLKLPTGSNSRLHGSGSTDLGLWLTGSDDYRLPGRWGHLTLFLSGGGMALTEGQVLEDQQRNLVGFGSLGFGWAPAEWIALKAQLSVHSPFYQGSDLNELTKPAVQLLFGGACRLAANTALDLALSEDITETTSPDIALHIGLSHHY